MIAIRMRKSCNTLDMELLDKDNFNIEYMAPQIYPILALFICAPYFGVRFTSSHYVVIRKFATL